MTTSANAQPTGWIGWIDGFNLGRAFDGAVAKPAFFARDSSVRGSAQCYSR